MKKIALLVLVSLLACLVFAQAVESFGKSNNSAFTIGARNTRNMQVGFTLPDFTVAEETVGTASYSRIVMPNSGSLMESGMPELPTVSTSIAIPIRGKVSIEVVSSQQRNIPAFMPYPVQQGSSLESPKSFVINNDFYSSGTNYPIAAIQYGDPVILRDFRIITVQVNPFSFNPQTGELTVHENIEFQLNFSNENGPNELSSEPMNISPSFVSLYEGAILNFSDYRDRVVTNAPPRYLLIYGNNTDPTFLTALDNFVLWKRQKGADVTVASTAANEAGTSTTTIKNYIQAKYNDPNTRPDFVILLGDTAGSYTIPAWTVSSGGGDYPYTHLAGSDIIGDVFIGRISVENLSQLTTLFSKIYLYEKDLNLATADWLNRMLLVGDTAHSGISTIYINKYLKESALMVNPDYTFTELLMSGPSPSAMNTAINQGVGLFNYRGYIGMSSWSPSETSLSNSYKLLHAVIITCATGNYSGSTATTETFTRLGTSAITKGAVTAIGMSTSSTHTTFNNCLNGGIIAGIYSSGMRTMGEALLAGKVYMSQIFGVSSPSNVTSFTHWCNLMGDPTMEVYTGIPDYFVPTSEPTIPLGLSLYDVAVLDGEGNPVEGAAVVLSMGMEIISRAYTGIDGNAILVLPSGMTAGDAVLTISKHNFKPSQVPVLVQNVPTLVPAAIVIDDDNTGASSGDGNGIAGSDETVELLFGLTNTGTTAITGVTGTLTSANPYITIINPNISYPSIPGGEVGINTNPVVIQIAPNTPNETLLRLHLNLTDGSMVTYHVSEFVPVEAPQMQYVSQIVIDSNNQVIDPGETVEFSVTVTNAGTMNVTGVVGKLFTLNDMVGVTDFSGNFGDIAAGVQVTCGTDRFVLAARPETLPGTVIPLQLKLYNDLGFEQWVNFTITVGQVASTDPLGPDAYGYVIYDWTDTAYPSVAVYDWHGISPSEGGLGTPLAISDGYTSSDEGDQVGADALEVVNLPFPFQFYGILYDQITVCSNGFIAMGVSANAEFRNFRLPGAMGPNPMIAPFWDDLATVSGSGIYTWFDRSNQSFVIQWNNMRNGKNGTSVETFQCILYDQAAYPTSFGDGPIKFQYHTFNNVDSQSGTNQGNYCTIGIEDHTGQVGLEYTFNNTYPTAAAQLSSGKALYITNAPIYHQEAHLIVDATYVDDNNGNGICEPGETVELGLNIVNSGNMTADPVTAELSCGNANVTINNATSAYFPIQPGEGGVNRYPFSITIADDCPDGEVLNFVVQIVSNESTWTRQFSLQVDASNLKYKSFMIDDHDTNFNGILDAGESANLIINLLNESVVDASYVQATLSSTNTQLQIANPIMNLDHIAPNEILQIAYVLDCSQVTGVENFIPMHFSATSTNGSPISIDFDLPYNNPNILQNFELSDGSFTPETGWVWGTPTQVTPSSGQKLWATNLSGSYPNLVQYHLYTPAYLLSTGSIMKFKHSYAFESGYDGGNVSISTNNGQTWTIIQPSTNYNGTNLNGLNGEAGWTGSSSGWQNPQFNLASYAGQTVMFRFRFGSDGGTTNTGWFIDDFELSGVNQKTGFLYGIVYPSSGVDPSAATVSSAQRYTTHPDAEGNFRLFLPNGTHSVTASLAHHQSSTLNSVVINPENPSHYTEFTLIDLPKPLSLSFDVNNDTGALNVSWLEPVDTVLPVMGYKVYRKFDSGQFEMVSETQQTQYQETISLLGHYRYYVRVEYLNVEGSPSDTLDFIFPYVANPNDSVPGLVNALGNNYPNPFNPSTTISFSLAKPGRTTLAIFNLKGQLVTRLVNTDLSQGLHSVVWNGKDTNNRSVASGMYFYRIESGDFRAVKKMLLMK
jgi:hypothetical protein